MKAMSSSGRRPSLIPKTGLAAASLFLSGILLALAFGSLLMGAGSTPASDALAYLMFDPVARTDTHLSMVIGELRFSRLLAALLVGSALGSAGAMLQAVTRNPLAETGILGINGGAALAVVAGITYFNAVTAFSWLIWSFGGALAGCGLVLLVSRAKGRQMTPMRLVLAGIALGASFRGLTSAILFANQVSYDQYRFWVLGSLAGLDPVMIRYMGPAVIAGLFGAALLARRVSALLLEDDTARNLEYSPALVRLASAGVVTLLAGASVALAGPIGFLGLMAPHGARIFTGPRMLPFILVSALIGAILLLGADMMARVVVKPFETPASVLVAIMGSPLMIYLAWRNKPLAMKAGPRGR